MKSFDCPYCQNAFALHSDTYTLHYINANGVPCTPSSPTALLIEFFICPKCECITIRSQGIGGKISFPKTPLLPKSLAKQFPDYIPETIRNDYEEACATVNLSPKASATLSRRCLQGMIRDFWEISEKNLYLEIDALKDKIPSDLWSSIDALRQLGNIGAHMEKDTDVIVDIDPNEAESLIKLIELLIKEWYINREERKKLFSDIIVANTQKQIQRKKIE